MMPHLTEGYKLCVIIISVCISGEKINDSDSFFEGNVMFKVISALFVIHVHQLVGIKP